MKRFFTIFIAVLFFNLSFSQTTYTWTGTSSGNWNTNTNWNPNGIPGAADNAVIVTGANNCILAGNTTITNLTITSGVLNLNNFTLNTSGIVACNGGSCNNGTFNSTASSLTFAGTTFGANITANVTDVYFNGSTFNGSVTLTRNNTTNIQSSGNNVFNGTTSITNAGAGYLLLTNSSVRTETFNGATTFNTTGSGNLYVAYNGNAIFAGNTIVNNTTSTGSTYLGNNGKVTFNPGISLTTGTFAGGMLYLSKFTQAAGTAINLNPGVNGGVSVNSSTVNAAFTVTAGNIYVSNTVFNDIVTLNKNGGTNNASSGNNTFNSTLTMNHTGAGYWGMGNGTRDIYNGDVYLNNTCNSERIILGQSSSNNQLNGNVYISQSGAAQGIAIGWGGTAPIMNLASGKSIIVGGGGFSAGYLQLYRITQAGSAALNITGTGTANVKIQECTFNGTINITAPDIYPYGGTYNSPVVFTKTGGGTGNHNNGFQNIFNSTLELNNQNGGGYILLSYQSNDQFNDNVTVTSTGTAGGISFGWSGGTGNPVLAAGKTISVGPAGFSSGYLQLGNFTQLGSTPLTLTLTGTAYFQALNNGTGNCTFNAPVNVTAPDIYLRGSVFNNASSFTKTGGGDDHNSGNLNVFNGPLEINNQSTTGYFMLGYNSNDLFNDDITVTNTGTRGIYLGFSSGTGFPVLASGKTVKVGTAGFTGGFLYFGGFTQLGSAPVNLNFAGTSTMQYYRASTFGGNIDATAGGFYYTGSTFNGTVKATKTGSSNDASAGGNTFSQSCEFNNNGSGYFGMGWNSPDIFNGDFTANNNSSERFLLGYASTGNQFNGNITLSSTGTSSGIAFCTGNATATATQAAGFGINVGTYNAGYLIFTRFTQLGTAAVNINLTSGSNYLQFGPGSAFGGNVTSISPRLFFHGCTFNGLVTSEKNGANDDQSNGGNIFNGATTITSSGSGYLMMGNGSPDQYNSTVNFNNTGTNNMHIAYNSAGNVFNGVTTFSNNPAATTGIYVATNAAGNSVFNDNIIASNNNGSGIYFGNSTGTATLSTGKTITVGAAGFNAGTLSLRNFTQIGSTAQSFTTTGTSTIQYGPFSSFDGNVTSLSPRLYFNGCTFNGTTNCTKNGAGSDASNGANIFNGSALMTNSGSGYLMFGNGNADQFNTTATFNNTGSDNIYLAYNSTGNVFGGVVTLNNAPSVSNAWIQVANGSSNTAVFNDNIIVSNANGGGVYFGNGVGTTTLSAGKTITIGAGGFNAGSLVLRNFTQVGATAQSLTTTGTSLIQYGPSSSFGGNVTSVSPRIYFNGCSFAGVTNFTKNGANNDDSNGANTFTGNSVITNSGSGYLSFGNINQDVFMSDVTVNNIGTNNVYMAHNSNGNIFNGNLYLTNSSTGQIYLNYYTYTTNYNGNIVVTSTAGGGIRFGEGSGSAILAAGKTITIGAGGFSTGTLMLKNFTQVGPTPQSLPQLTGTALLQLGPASTFDGDVTFNFPQVLLHGTTYNGTATIQKNGATDNPGNGGNIFNGTTIITNSGSGYLMTGNGTRDQFNGLTTFNDIGSYRIYLANNHSGQTTTFAQNVIFNGAKTSGSDSWTYLIAENAGSNVSFGGNVTINISGSIQSNFRILNGGSTAATYNGNLILNLSNTNISTQMQFGVAGTSQYNGNISVTNSGGANGVYFNMNSSATSTLAATKTISVGATGFSAGTLSLARFTQLSATSQSLTLTGTGTLYFGPTSQFNGDVTSTSPSLFFSTTTFNGAVTSTKNGTTNDASPGGNIFNGISNFTASGTGYLLFANSTADAYNNNVTFNQNGTGPVYPNYNTNCTYAGNITIASTITPTITFGSAGNGIATLNGSNAQVISKSGTVANPVFTRLIVNKSGNDVTLNTRINISTYLTLTQGIINTTQANILNMNNAATTTIGNATSYINGPMNYDMAVNGSRTLNFPIGKASDWRPAVLDARHNSGTSYTYNSEVFNADANTLGWTLPVTVNTASHVHWWDIVRSNTSTGVVTPTLNLNGNQTITLYYGANDGVTDPTYLTILKNTYTAGTTWIDIGGTGATVTAGSVSSTSSPSAFNSFSRFTLGNKILGSNPLPIELLYFNATAVNNETVDLDWATATETNNSHFEIERSADGANFEYLATVKAYGNGNSVTKQTYQSFDKNPLRGVSYYRLKQVDKNSTFTYSDIVAVQMNGKSFISLFPNPASDNVSIYASSDYETANIKIINASGALVKASMPLSAYNGSINLSDLAVGLYFVVIENGKNVQNIKISVQR